MTSRKLLDYVQTHRVLESLSFTLEPNEVFRAALFAQSEILRQCELLDEYVTADLIANQEVYESTDAGWDFLARTVRVKSAINATAKSPLTIVDEQWVDGQREAIVLGGTKPRPPRFLYHRLTDPISIGVWGDPDAASSVNLCIVRGHSDDDDISDSVNPIIPAGYDELLVIGTVCKLLDFRKSLSEDNKKYLGVLQAVRSDFENAKVDAKLTRSAIQNQGLRTNRLKW